jgi:hypothetical protein
MPASLNEERLGFVQLNVPNLLEVDNVKPDFDKLRFKRLFELDHLPLKMVPPLLKPTVKPLIVFEILKPCLVLYVAFLPSLADAFMPDVLEALNLSFESSE